MDYLKKNNKINKEHNKIFIQYFNDYDWKKYIEMYKDLNLNDEIKACNHYLNEGKKDKEIYSRNNNIKDIKDINKESITNILKLQEEVQIDIKKTKQIIKNKYDWNYYLITNTHILNIISVNSINDLIDYFIFHDIYKEDVILYLLENNNETINQNIEIKKIDKSLEDDVHDWNSYINDNLDLKENGINNIFDAFGHYVLYGKNEGRKIKFKQINIINPENLVNFIDYYEKYDWNLYLLQYPDLLDNKINTEMKACIHYLKTGCIESRLINLKKNLNKKDDSSKNNKIEDSKNKPEDIKNKPEDNSKNNKIINNSKNNKIIDNSKNNKIIDNKTFYNKIDDDKVINNKIDDDKVIDNNNENIMLKNIYNKINNSKNNNCIKYNEVLSDNEELTMDSFLDNDSNNDSNNDSDDDSNNDSDDDSNNDSDDDSNNDSDDDSDDYSDKKFNKESDKESENDSLNDKNLLLNNEYNIIEHNTFEINCKICEEYDINFDLSIYKYLNNDLKFLTDIEYYLHFIKSGKMEYRAFSKKHLFIYQNYDWDKFQKSYKLKISNSTDYLRHYLKNSKKYIIYPKYNIHNFNIDFCKLYFHLETNDEDNTIVNKNLKIYENNELYKLFLMNNDHDKIYFNYSNYFIYQLIDWNYFYENNTIQVENNKNDLFCFFMKEIKNNNTFFNIKFNFNFFQHIQNFNSKINEDLDLFKYYLKNHIINHKNEYLIDLYTINNYLTNIDDKYKILDIPPLFEIDNFIIDNENLHFTFIIYANNIENNVKYNLLSILYQNYKNWNIIYINDNSNDKTDNEVKQFIKDYQLEKKIVYKNILSKKNESFVKFNIYKEVDINSICILLNGNNWLSKNDSLSIIADKFINTQSLFIYSGYKLYNKNQLDNILDTYCYSDEVKLNNLYRTHYKYDKNYLLCTYSNLLKQIDEKYYKLNGEWIDNCNNLIDFFCLAELSGTKLISTDDVLYIIDKTNYNNDNNELTNVSTQIEDSIRKIEPINIYLPPVYTIHINQDIFSQFNKKHNIYNYKIIKDIITLNIDLNQLISLFENINKNANYNHILIIKNKIYIYKYFTMYYKINNHKILNKDFIHLGYNIEKNDEVLHKFNKNNEFISLEYTNNTKTIKGCCAFICSRKYRDYFISYLKEYNKANIKSLEDFNNLILNNYDLLETSKLNYYLYNKNLFITDDDEENYYKNNKININNYLV